VPNAEKKSVLYSSQKHGNVPPVKESFAKHAARR